MSDPRKQVIGRFQQWFQTKFPKKKHFATPQIGEIKIRDSNNWVFDEMNEIKKKTRIFESSATKTEKHS